MSMMYLHDYPYTTSPLESYGSKAANLGKLMHNGTCRVPGGVVFGPDFELVASHVENALQWVIESHGIYGRTNTKWAVRSSGLAEDGDDSSYAGQHDTYLNVEPDDVLPLIEKCRASGVKAEAYREAKGEESKGIAVLVQLMVEARWAGVMFTADPTEMDLNTSIIEYTNGLGDKLVAGEVNPDGSYEVDNTTQAISPELTSKDVMTKAIRDIHEVGTRIANLFQTPMDIEWVIDFNYRVWIVQARPLTTGGRKWVYPEFLGRTVVKGRAEGVAVWAKGDDAENTLFDEGNILLAHMTNPHMVPLMLKSSGIATQIGGRTCHAAIVSRELNKPCVVGVGNLSVLQSKTRVVLDATAGKVIA
jgi:pyruvate,water dikinase